MSRPKPGRYIVPHPSVGNIVAKLARTTRMDRPRLVRRFLADAQIYLVRNYYGLLAADNPGATRYAAWDSRSHEAAYLIIQRAELESRLAEVA